MWAIDKTDGIPFLTVLIIILTLFGTGIYYASKENEKEQVDIEKTLRIEIEKAYYEGQRDYAEGIVRIRDERFDHCYHWVESPWDGGNLDSVVYKPECTVKKEE
jgi:hypothetical protein